MCFPITKQITRFAVTKHITHFAIVKPVLFCNTSKTSGFQFFIRKENEACDDCIG